MTRRPLPAALAVLCTALAAAPAGAQEPPPAPAESRPLQFQGELVNYGIYQSRALFGPRGRGWLETSVRAEVTLRRGPLTGVVEGLGMRTSGLDTFGTRSGPANGGARAGVAAGRLDKAYVEVAAGRWRVTAGRQPIAVGSQFLIGDAVYDGFGDGWAHAVYHNPRRGFDAVRARWDAGATHVDAFAFRVHPTWDAAGGDDGLFGGAGLLREDGPRGLAWGAGLYHRRSGSDFDNDMTVANLRASQPIDADGRVVLSGEWVAELAGACQNVVYCDAVGTPLRANAWHAEGRYQAKGARGEPWIEAGVVHYGPDFAPVATGFSDWGRWYLGNQIDWIVFGSDTRVARAEAGFAPSASTRARAQVHDTREARGERGSLATELALIGEWYPRDAFWLNVVLGVSRPGAALGRAGFANPFAVLNTGAAVVGMRTSWDIVIATGVKF